MEGEHYLTQSASDQVRHKPGRTASEMDKYLELDKRIYQFSRKQRRDQVGWLIDS